MTRAIDDYLREVETSLRVDASRKRQLVDELRTHLAERVEDVAREDPARPLLEVQQEVLREFGNPRELALAYEPEGAAVLTNSAGEIVLRLTQAVGRGAAVVGRGAVVVGRGTGKALKWLAISLAALLVVAIGVGAWAFYEVKPFIPAILEQSEPAYQYYERCAATPCSGTPAADMFFVRPEAKTVRLDLNVQSTYADHDRAAHVGNGTIRITITDPLGEVRLDRAINLSSDASTRYETSWSAMAGNWTVAYAFDTFVGVVDVETYAISFPWGEER